MQCGLRFQFGWRIVAPSPTTTAQPGARGCAVNLATALNTQRKLSNAGRPITITWTRPEGDVTEAAKIARATKTMLPLPIGYVPVRFADGGVLLVHASRIAERAS